MEDYRPNKQSVGESPKEQSLDASQPEQSVGVLQSVGEASRYVKRRQHLIATGAWDDHVKAATERKRKSRYEKVRMLLEKGGGELLQEYKGEETKSRKLRHDKKRKRRMMLGSGGKMQEMQLLQIQQGRNHLRRRKRQGN